jgi:hypothetical protein
MSLSIDITRFNLMIDEMGRRVGLNTKYVMRKEVGSILKKWAGLVKVTPPDQSERKSRQFLVHNICGSGKGVPAERGAWINIGNRSDKRNTLGVGGVWWRTPNTKSGESRFIAIRAGQGGGYTKRDGRKRAPLSALTATAQYDGRIAAEIVKGMGARSLARQSVVQAADMIGIRLEDVEGGGISAEGLRKARSAIASNGRFYQNGAGSEAETAKGMIITVTNRLPYGKGAKLDTKLEQAIRGRVSFFEKNLGMGVFKDYKTIADKYPGMKVGLNIRQAAGLTPSN